ncbi:hypothetical protein PYV61_24440 [Roseisolibacter sp. H3M3-2]|nr:hypothetical protein [Roseisolibacter sp. H3M3-2]
MLAAAAGCEGSYLIGVPDVARVEVAVAPARLAVGQGAVATGVAFRANGAVIEHARRAVGFRSTDTAVASVTGVRTGEVRALAAGTAWIVGESGGRRDSVRVTVTPAP